MEHHDDVWASYRCVLTEVTSHRHDTCQVSRRPGHGDSVRSRIQRSRARRQHAGEEGSDLV